MSPLVRRRLLRLGALAPVALAGSAGWVWLESRGVDDDPFPPPPPFEPYPLPKVELPGFRGHPPLSTAALPGPVLLNVFASWCPPCVAEMPVLMALRARGVAIWGIAFRDKEADAGAFLDRHGDPYARIGWDPDGKGAGALGLSAVPENLLADREGVVRWRFPAGLTEDIAEREVLTRIRSMA